MKSFGENLEVIDFSTEEEEELVLPEGEGVRICMIEDSEGGTTEASSRVGEGVVIVPEEWQLHPLPQSPPTHLVPLPDTEIDLPEEMLQPIPPKIDLRSLWRDFERTNYRLKELRRVIHSWEPKLTAMGGTVMEHHRVLTAVTTEVAQAQHTLFRQLEAARQEVENPKAQNLQLLQFQQQIQASVGNISQQVSKLRNSRR